MLVPNSLHTIADRRHRTVVVRSSLFAAFALLAACSVPSADARSTAAPQLDARAAVIDSADRERLFNLVRESTRKYQNPAVAIADGYVDEKMCVELPGVGGMGVHFIQPKNMGMRMTDGRIDGTDTILDVTKPEILVYEKLADGSLKLAAVEWYTARAAWGSRPRPTLFGTEFNEMFDDPSTADVDEGHGFTPHYDLHVWLYKENKAGVFSQWNPAVTCPAEPKGHGHGR